jgi:aminopeptidase N
VGWRLASGARIAALAAAACLAAAGPAAAQTFVDGSPGLGDPYYPLAGNGGYDVRHYSLRMDYERATNRLDAMAVIRARAKQNLRRFDLDLRGFEISKLTVNGHRARFERDGQELIVSPRPKLRKGRRFKVKVAYAGEPAVVTDPDESIEGWVPTADGAFVVNEPQGSPGWYPANDNPRDKATYAFAITVPEGITAIGNGRLISRRTSAGKTTWRWREDSPMAPYLATATNGKFELRITKAGRIPLYHAVDPAEVPKGAFDRLAPEPEIIEFFSGLYGRYPFSSGGGVVDHAPEVGYALESQTKSQYDETPSASTVVHEIAHQWFGNAVTLEVWPDIWLNEGFAQWSEWIYDERHGGKTAQQAFDELYATPATDDAFWNPPPGDPGGPEHLFDGTVYDRGSMTLQALRGKVGDRVFFRILRRWYRKYRYGNARTADFVALSERLSGRQLDDFFEVWLYRPGKPASW